MSTFFQDNADATKKIALDASTISTGTTRTLIMPDRDVDLNDPQNPSLPHGFSAPQSYTPHTMATAGVIEAAKSQYQKFTATADTVLSFDATPTPGTPFTVEVDPAGFVIDVPAAWNGFGRYSQASTTDKFLIELYVRSDSSVEILRSTAVTGGGTPSVTLPGESLDWRVPGNNTLVEWQTAITDTIALNPTPSAPQLVGSFPQRRQSWQYATYGGNGKIYTMFTSSEIAVLDCATYETERITTTNSSRARGLVLSGDGGVYGIQDYGTKLIRIDTANDTAADVTPTGTAPPLSSYWMYGFRSFTGELYFFNARASQVYKYNPATNTGSLLTGTGYVAGTTAASQRSGVQLSTDGFAYIATVNGTTIQKFDPSNDTCTSLPTFAAMGSSNGNSNIQTEGLCLTRAAEIFVPPGRLGASAKVINTSTLTCNSSATAIVSGTTGSTAQNLASYPCLDPSGRCFYGTLAGSNFDASAEIAALNTSNDSLVFAAAPGEDVIRIVNGPDGKLFAFNNDIPALRAGELGVFGGVIDTGTAGWSTAVLNSPFI